MKTPLLIITKHLNKEFYNYRFRLFLEELNRNHLLLNGLQEFPAPLNFLFK